MPTSSQNGEFWRTPQGTMLGPRLSWPVTQEMRIMSKSKVNSLRSWAPKLSNTLQNLSNELPSTNLNKKPIATLYKSIYNQFAKPLGNSRAYPSAPKGSRRFRCGSTWIPKVCNMPRPSVYLDQGPCGLNLIVFWVS